MNFQKFWLDNLKEAIGTESERKEVGYEVDYESDIPHVLKAVSEEVEEEILVRSLQSCGRCCLDPVIIHNAKKYYTESGDNLDAVLEELNRQGIGGGSMQRQGNRIYASYAACFCPNAKTESVLPQIYCNCSRGWFMELFEGVLGHPVKVEVEQSIIRGADKCKFVIYL